MTLVRLENLFLKFGDRPLLVNTSLAIDEHERICLIEPQDYASFVWLEDHCTLVLTDSGGVQEEAPSLGKPVLVMRETSERPEGIRAGNARLVGVDRAKIAAALVDLITHPEERQKMAQARNPYGDGQSAQKIVDILYNSLAAAKDDPSQV